jgi:PAS domain S-box-containing protein
MSQLESDTGRTRAELLREIQQLRRQVSRKHSNPIHRYQEKRRWAVTSTWLRIGFAISILCLGATGIASHTSIDRLVKDRHQLENTNIILGEIDRIRGSIESAEQGQKGYLASKNPDLLAIHHQHIRAAKSSLERLARLMPIKDPHRRQVREIQALLDRDLQDFDPTLPVDKLQANDDRLHREIEAKLAELYASEKNLLDRSIKAAESGVYATNTVVGVGYILSFILLSVVLWLLEREIAHRNRAEDAVIAINNNLETIVSERTAELSESNHLLAAEIEERGQQAARMELLYSVVENTTDGVMISAAAPIGVGTADIQIVYANPAFVASTGYSVEELIGRSPNILHGPETDISILGEMQEIVGRGEPMRTEIINYRKDGTPYWAEIGVFTVPDPDGSSTHWVAIGRDISERKQAEFAARAATIELERRVDERTAALSRTTTEIEDLYNHAPCGYHSIDRHGRIVRINSTELNWLGYDRTELMGRRYIDLLTPASLATLDDKNDLLRRRGWCNDIELDLICKNGSLLSVSVNIIAIYDADGDCISSRSTLFDLRHRKQMEAALRKSEGQFRSLSESSPIGIFMKDHLGGVIYVNPRIQEITGLSYEDTLGDGWIAAIHPEDLPYLLAHDNDPDAEPQVLSFPEVRFVQPDGTVRCVRIKLAPIFNEAGELTSHVGTIEDITEQRLIQTMKDEFVSIVSHELRTPLTAIRGSLGLLANGVYDDKPEKGQKMLELALTQTERLVRLVSDILDLKRLESNRVALHRQIFDVSEAILQAIDATSDLAHTEGVEIDITTLLSVEIHADLDAIVQTLTNLIGNAIKFSPPQSKIGIRAEELAATASTPRSILFSVKDTGRGIPADKLEHVFGQFQQVDASDSRQKGGTGLGLAICRNIVELHGGKIWAESTLGVGSTFYFTIPTDIEID